MTDPTRVPIASELEALHDTQRNTVSVEAPVESTTSGRTTRWWLGPIPVTLALACVIGGGYVAYQRVGTTANANAVEYTQNLADGFVALGFTEDQPGFVVLSAVNQPLVEITTDLVSNRLAGTHTVVGVQTRQGKWRKRLRGPQLVLVDREGRIDASPVDWSLGDFAAIRKGINCDHGGASKRCGAPFADLHELLANWDKQRVPEKARRFLAPFADRHVGGRTQGQQPG